MDDEEDLKKIIEVLKHSKQENADDFQYDEFINCEDNDSDEQSQVEDSLLIAQDYDIPEPAPLDVLNIYKYDPVASLKPDEKLIIESCTDPELKQLLLLNRTKCMRLIQLYKKMKDLLIECKQNIIEKTEVVKAARDAIRANSGSTGAWKLAAPYFKDQHLYPSPQNDDTIKMKKNGELTIFDFMQPPRWASIECDRLLRSIKINYNINQQIKIRRQIDDMLRNDDQKQRINEIRKLEDRLKELKANDDSEVPPRYSDEDINWVRVSEVCIRDKHSDFECSSFWHIYLHPDINKSAWTPEEKSRLKTIATKYKQQNWDCIAKELGTNRSCLQVCITYFTNFHSKYKRGEFTCEEDYKLLNLVEKHRMGSYIPWSKIVNEFEDRNRMQLHHRYTYYLSQKDKKKGKYSEAEDIMLMIAVDKFGRNFKKCQEYLPKRSMAQCRARYSNNCCQFLKKGVWNCKDDEMIMDYVNKYGTKAWSGLVKVLHRTRGQLRQRYHIISNFLQANPEKTIADVTKKKYKLDKEENSYTFARSIADKYRDREQMPTLAEIEDLLRTRYNKFVAISSEDEPENSEVPETENKTKEKEGNLIMMQDIDRMLTDFFCNSFKIRFTKETSVMNLKRAINDVEKVLDILQTNLEIPSDLDGFDQLDAVDKAILEHLDKNNFAKHREYNQVVDRSTSIIEHIPPSFHNTIGMRSLLIKNIHYKRRSLKISRLSNNPNLESANAIKKDLSDHISMLDPLKRDTIQADRNLYFRRFYSLFKWPALLTLDSPTAELQSISEGLDCSIVPDVKRTYSRKNKNTAPVSTEQPNVKKLKITELPKTKTQNVLKLTPVTDKSVIENLMKDKNKKLFCFNKVKQGGQEKTLIQEVKLSFNNHANMLNSSKPGPSVPLIRQYNSKSSTKCKNKEIEMQDTTSNGNSNSMEDMQNLLLSQKQVLKQEPGPSTTAISVDQNNSNNMDTIDPETDSDSDDAEDVKKLNLLLYNELDQIQDCTDDIYDLERLNIFLKEEREQENDSD